jgi:phage shock protein PspC (stress-responsive transcriptional regulator)
MESGRPPGHLPQARPGGRGHGLVRPREGKVVAGVLAGLANRFGISPWTARAIFLLSLLLPGPQVLAYLVLWVVMPSER